MSEPLNTESSRRIVNHMNQDHQDAIDSYVRNYGIDSFVGAKMLNLTPEAIEVQLSIKIPFDHILQDCADAKNTLVSMIK